MAASLWLGALAAPAQGAIAPSLHAPANCVKKDAADGEIVTDVEKPFWFCDDGVPSNGGMTPGPGGTIPNTTGDNAVTVPAKYNETGNTFAGLPLKAADAATVPGNVAGNIALDVDISLPDTAPPVGGYPVIFMMHGCCSGNRKSWEAETIDQADERWHYSNAWFASRGYVVVTYTSRGFVNNLSRGSTGQTQLDSRSFEINDFQALACNVFANASSFDDVNSQTNLINPNKMVTTGGSYGGGFSWMALTDPLWTCTMADTGTSQGMSLAAAAPRYGWTDLAYTLVPNGMHSELPTDLPQTNGCDTGPLDLLGAACTMPTPNGMPKSSIVSLLYATGTNPSGDHTTFPQSITDAFTCLQSAYPLGTAPLVCDSTLSTTLPEFLRERSAYYQNDWFTAMPTTSALRVPIFNAGTLTDPLFPAYENRRMANRILNSFSGYPIKQYYGDYQHFVQNKTKEWGDVCDDPAETAPDDGRHVCTLAAGDYPGNDPNATPSNLVPGAQTGTGVTTRLNRFIDNFAQPTGGYPPAAPSFDVTASLQVCPQNATGGQAADEPGERFTAATFEALATNFLNVDITGDQTTTNDVVTGNLHAGNADPFTNFAYNGGRCPVEASVAPDAGVASYTSNALPSDATMIGAPTVTIDFTATGDMNSLQLNSRLYDVLPNGTAVMIDRGPRRLTLAEATGGPVVYELHGNGWKFPAGHRVRIEIAQDDEFFVKHSDPPSATTISHVDLAIPIREATINLGGSADPKPPPATTPPPATSSSPAATRKCPKGASAAKKKKGCKKKKKKKR